MVLVWMILFSGVLAQPVSHQPVDYVNPLIGTAPFEDAEYLGNNPPEGEELYCGSVVPGAMALDGVVKLSPDTGFDGIFHVRGSAYRYTDSSIMGFSHTHHEYNRYANVLFMPIVGPVKTIPGSRDNPDEGYRSRKDIQQEQASAGYYTVFLSDYGIKVELTATKNAGFHRYTFGRSERAHILIDLSTSQNPIVEAYVEVLDNRRIAGWQKCRGYTVNFHAEFSKPFSSFGTWKDGAIHQSTSTQTGHPIGAFVDYTTSAQEVVLAKVGISFIDIEKARKNLTDEIDGWDFNQIHKQTKDDWNELLRRIEVKGGTDSERVNFYTSLYRVMVSEKFFSWPNGGALYFIVRPETAAERLAQASWNTSRGGFWGPGNASWVAGAYNRGFRNFDVAAAYESLRQSATNPKQGWQRLSDYMRLGYIPTEEPTNKGQLDDHVPGGRPDVVNRTLGYAYDDYCIAQLAKVLGRNADYEYFIARSSNYRLLFDPIAGFMRARQIDGSWVTPFNPTVPFGQRFYREGTAWHYLWLVPHDVQGLIDLLGGRDAFVKKLDEFFNTPYNPKFPMRDLTGIIGQYVHGNETDRQVPYYYNYAGAPWKSQEVIRKIMKVLHKPVPGGLCGMDDNGYLTGWYVFSAMGFYPVEPSKGVYVIGSPVFRKVKVYVQGPDGDNGEFVIEAHNASEENIYIFSRPL
ncbi:MAG: GH92 family glycosyl hydrolase [Phycisphaerae bacterium]